MAAFFQEGGTVASIPELLERVTSFLGAYPIDSVYLRGQCRHKWKLLPSISRKMPYAGLKTGGYDEDREKNLLHRFRRYARAFLGHEVDERELPFLARHHGIPVRLLDWTSNPLVALYYACVGDEHRLKDGAVWIFLRRKHFSRNDYYDVYNTSDWPPLLDIKGLKIIYAPYVTPRIPAQNGHFTAQEHPGVPFEEHDPADFAARDFDVERIEKWKVPFHKKTPLLRDLERCGINERTLFPDLDGIARSIVRTEVLRNGRR